MSETVTLFTDRSGIAPLWRAALERQGLVLRLGPPEELATALNRGMVAIFDAGASAYDEDELLSAAAFARALGARPVVHADDHLVEEIVEDLCDGRVARDVEDVDRVASRIARDLDPERGRRFEFVTVSPRTSELLAVFGNGTSALLRRPLGDADDGSEVMTIALSDDAREAAIEFESGASLTLDIEAVAPSSAGVSAGVQVDGARLGARLRELRLEAGLTQAELARRTGIHRPNIARVEAGRHTPSLETLSRLAGAIGVSPTRVLADE